MTVRRRVRCLGIFTAPARTFVNAAEEIVGEGDIRLVTGDEPGQLTRQIALELQDEPVLKAAWQQFATGMASLRRLMLSDSPREG
jgi:hypothetical protein